MREGKDHTVVAAAALGWRHLAAYLIAICCPSHWSVMEKPAVFVSQVVKICRAAPWIITWYTMNIVTQVIFSPPLTQVSPVWHESYLLLSYDDNMRKLF